MKTILKYLRPHSWHMVAQLVIKFIGTIMDLLIPWILSYIIDDITPLGQLKPILFWGSIMVVCAVTALVGNIVANRMAAKIARDTTELIRHDLFAKITYLSCEQTDRFTMASLISRLTSDTYNVHHMLGMMQRIGIRAPILLLGGIGVTLTLDPVLSLVLITTLPLLGTVVYFVSRKGIPLYSEVQKASDKMVSKIQENMSGVRVIKALSKSEHERERFDEVSVDVVLQDKKASMIMSITNPSMQLLLNLGLCAVIVVGALRVNSGAALPGAIIAFLSYFTIILNAMMMITRIFVMYSKGAASAKRIEEVMKAERQLLPQACEAKENSPWHIEFDGVDFSYNGVANNLTDISFGLKKGESLGIIGETGSGKTTLISLLLRFYDCNGGGIYIDGVNVKAMDANELHSKFGVVFQSDFLFADTIKSNIDFFRGVTQESVEKASQTAQAEFVYDKENGFDHMLTVKGANMSGGQKQRLLIARAVAAKPEILVLDDASSALDYKTDAQLRLALQKELGDTTTVVVAQRVSSVKSCDLIIMMKDGKIAAKGTHKKLYAENEAYREICDAQMEMK